MKERIAVAMSGGVDSSTAAYILKEKGYDIIGINMRIWNYLPEDGKIFGSCCSLEDVADARRVADKLKIPFYVLNLEEEFKREVVDYFISSYVNGCTPNPCVLCNKKIKFGHLIKRVKEIGASRVATGHYACILTEDRKYPVLKRGIDKDKDQSYFLFNLSRDQLRDIIMPLGSYTKPDIRRIAKSMGLPVADKKDSQEICFIPDRNYAGFIKDRINKNLLKEGDIVNREGKILGRHKGNIFYTIGQRRGLDISSKYPLYVLHIDKDMNRITVGGKNELYKTEFMASDVNWLKDVSIGSQIKADVQIRYRHSASRAKIVIITDNKVKIIFNNCQSAITPGQAAVFYNNDEVIGGGWITKTE